MLSDEMTTGSVTTLDADKRVYASRSHAWNLQQRRFRDAFPDVSTHVLYVSKLCPPPDIAPKVYHDCGACLGDGYFRSAFIACGSGFFIDWAHQF
jgi:hypothetical protein